MKIFYYDRGIKIYIYAFMYLYPETMAEEDHFTATKVFVKNCKNISIPVPVPKYWIGFS